MGPLFAQVHTLLAIYHLPVESLDATWCKELYKNARAHLSVCSQPDKAVSFPRQSPKDSGFRPAWGIPLNLYPDIRLNIFAVSNYYVYECKCDLRLNFLQYQVVLMSVSV